MKASVDDPALEIGARLPAYVSFVPPICIGLLLFFAFRLYRYAYFTIDDFNNLYWVQQWTFGQSLQMILSASTEYFRPVGMLVYRSSLALFGLDAGLYHWLLWTLHTLNVVLVYFALKHFTRSRAGASAGALLFACPPVFTDIFANFGTVFEVTGFALFLCGLLIWEWKERPLGVAILAAGVFVLSLKAKEMAITLPVIWLLQDLLLRRTFQWKAIFHWVIPTLVGIWFTLQKVAQMGGSATNHPYYMDLRGITLGRGFAYYFNTLFVVDVRWQHLAIGFVALVMGLLIARHWRAAFFQSYVLVTLLPVIFLVNHREPFYWYFPLFGICGLAALLVKHAVRLITRRVPVAVLAPGASLVFALACWGSYLYLSRATLERRMWQTELAEEYRHFVDDLRRLPSPAANETLFFTSAPNLLDATVLKMAAQVALRRTDIDAKLVDEFPENAAFRLEFIAGRIVRQ